MTLLSTITAVCEGLSLDVPDEIMASTDPGVMQLRRLAARCGREISQAYDWQTLRVEQTWSCLGTVAQTGMLPSDFDRFCENTTIFNTSRNKIVSGPTRPEIWQRLKVIGNASIDQYWCRIGDVFQLLNASAGETLDYFYVSKNWITHGDGSTGVTLSGDDDLSRFPERIWQLAIIYWWKRAKGFDYAQEVNDYLDAFSSEVGSDRGPMVLNLTRTIRGNEVPANFWPGQILG